GWAQAVDAHSTGAPISTTAAANRGPQDRLTLICHPPGRTNVLPERGRVPVPPWVNETRRGQSRHAPPTRPPGWRPRANDRVARRRTGWPVARRTTGGRGAGRPPAR